MVKSATTRKLLKAKTTASKSALYINLLLVEQVVLISKRRIVLLVIC